MPLYILSTRGQRKRNLCMQIRYFEREEYRTSAHFNCFRNFIIAQCNCNLLFIIAQRARVSWTWFVRRTLGHTYWGHGLGLQVVTVVMPRLDLSHKACLCQEVGVMWIIVGAVNMLPTIYGWFIFIFCVTTKLLQVWMYDLMSGF